MVTPPTISIRTGSSIFLLSVFAFCTVVNFPAETNRHYFVVNASVSSSEPDEVTAPLPDGRVLPPPAPAAASYEDLYASGRMAKPKEARIVSNPAGTSTNRKQNPVVLADSAGSDIVVFTRRTTTTSSTTNVYLTRMTTPSNRPPLKNEFTTPVKVWWNPQEQAAFTPTPGSTSSSTLPSRPSSTENTTGADSNTTVVIDFKEIINAPEFKCPGDQKKDHQGKCRDIYYS